MFTVAILIGIYSYGIFALGLLGILTPLNIAGFSLSFLLIALLAHLHFPQIPRVNLSRTAQTILGVLIIQQLVNLLPVFAPELGFDALWYHLSLPKIWLQEELIRFLPGATFRYSVMPKLIETLYAAVLSAGLAFLPKLMHFIFGQLSLILTYQLARKFLNTKYSLFAVLIFSSNLVFSWLSGSAYVDLARTFFEVLALLLFIERKYPQSALTLGLAITTKILSLTSLPVFLILQFLNKPTRGLLPAFRFAFLALMVPAPWFIFAYLTTANPLYPIFSPVLEPFPISLNPLDLFFFFSRNPDPVNPIYLISAPLIFKAVFEKQSRGVREIFLYTLLSLSFWFILPHSGTSRFVLPYLPALSIISVYTFVKLSDQLIRKTLFCLVLLLAIFSILYRLAANFKYLPVITGDISQTQFLKAHLNFQFGDFFDTTEELPKYIGPDDTVLVSGINNLYYADFRFIHDSYAKPHDTFGWIIVRRPDSTLKIPDNFYPVYSNSVSNFTLFGKK